MEEPLTPVRNCGGYGKNMFLCLSLLSKTTVPWPSCSLQISYTPALCAAPCNCSTCFPILMPRHLGNWPDKWHAGPHPRAEAPSIVIHIRGVNEGALPAFFFISQCELISSCPNHCFKKSCCEIRFHHWSRLFCSFPSHPTFTASWLCTTMNLLSSSIILSRLLS